MFPQEQFPGQGPSSAGAPRVPPGLSGSNPVNWPTSSSSYPPPEPPGAAWRDSISLPTKLFQLPVEPQETDDARIEDMPLLSEVAYDNYDADDDSDYSSVLGGAEGKPPVSLKQTKFSSKKFANRMGQANYSVCNKWKKVWVTWILEKKHWSIMWGQNHFKQLRNGPLPWETVVTDVLETFGSWLRLDNFDNAKWIRRQWTEMILKICASEIQAAKKMGRQGSKRLATDLGQLTSKRAMINTPELLKITFLDGVCRVSNCNYCSQRVRVTRQQTGFGPAKWFGLVPQPSENTTCSVLVGQTWTRTCQPARFAGFG